MRVINSGKAAIFDIDGTLLDSMDIWHQIDLDFFASHGLELPSDYMAAVCPMKPMECARYTIERFHLDDRPEALVRLWDQMALTAYGTTVKPKPHAVQYVRYLKQTGASLAVATCLTPVVRDAALNHLGIAGYFDVAVSVDQTTSVDKNSPEVYLLAAAGLNIAPECCTVFEDLLVSTQVAKSAGMKVWAMRDDYAKADWEAIAAVADGVIDDFDSAPRLL
ncbi:HAD family hydrolase [Bifidobacterium bohemicum]|uniref:HAD family hydrolase n=1 Tax=Bifidobacterium bohemicum TaxID=638617 RepID=UPI0009459BEF|nr:HAD family phosphatase [Bifidobacterium bohemicum]